MNKLNGKLINQSGKSICYNENSQKLIFHIFNNNRVKIQCAVSGYYLTSHGYGNLNWVHHIDDQIQDFKIVVYIDKYIPYGIYSISTREYIGKIFV